MTRHALQLDDPVQRVDEVPDDGETEPGAAHLARAALVDAVEALEDAVVLVGGDAEARIDDFEERAAARCRQIGDRTRFE